MQASHMTLLTLPPRGLRLHDELLLSLHEHARLSRIRMTVPHVEVLMVQDGGELVGSHAALQTDAVESPVADALLCLSTVREERMGEGWQQPVPR